MALSRNHTGYLLIILTSLMAVIGVFFMPPIPQDTAYHGFSDVSRRFGIDNFMNVFSNAGFFLVGVYGLYKLLLRKQLNIIEEFRPAYIILFGGVTLVAFGSGYYHLQPNNQSLVWDRLPMTIAFMSLFSIIIAECVSHRAGKILLYPLIIAGVFSVYYWHITELKNAGDLRPYVLVQFLPMLIIPVILLTFKSDYGQLKGYWWLLLAYVLAKLFEFLDGEIHQLLYLISGHSLKHLVSALGVYFLLLYYINRQLICHDDRETAPPALAR